MPKKNSLEGLIDMSNSMHALARKTAPVLNSTDRRDLKFGAQLTAALLVCVPFLFVSGACVAADAADKEEWIQLFNGRNLDGWTPKITGYDFGENYANTFRVENGVLKVSYDKYDSFNGRFGHLFYKQPFSYYRLVVEYRFVGEQAKGNPGAWALRNSGVMVHSQSGSSMLRDQDFPICIEAQFLGGLSDGKERSTLNMCSPGTEIVYEGRIYPEHCLPSKSKTYRGDQWVRGEMLVLGSGQITHYVDGQEVLEYALPQMGGGQVNPFDPKELRAGELLDGGYLALQSESHPIEFRKVALLNLEGCMDSKATNYKRYYVKSNPKACRYAGKE
jgi:hypothetical protein